MTLQGREKKGCDASVLYELCADSVISSKGSYTVRRADPEGRRRRFWPRRGDAILKIIGCDEARPAYVHSVAIRLSNQPSVTEALRSTVA